MHKRNTFYDVMQYTDTLTHSHTYTHIFTCNQILSLACATYLIFSNLFHFIPLKNCWLQVTKLISGFTNKYLENKSYRHSLSFSPVTKFHSTGGLLEWGNPRKERVDPLALQTAIFFLIGSCSYYLQQKVLVIKLFGKYHFRAQILIVCSMACLVWCGPCGNRNYFFKGELLTSQRTLMF